MLRTLLLVSLVFCAEVRGETLVDVVAHFEPSNQPLNYVLVAAEDASSKWSVSAYVPPLSGELVLSDVGTLTDGIPAEGLIAFGFERTYRSVPKSSLFESLSTTEISITPYVESLNGVDFGGYDLSSLLWKIMKNDPTGIDIKFSFLGSLPSAVPEPSSLLIALGLFAVGYPRVRRRAARLERR